MGGIDQDDVSGTSVLWRHRQQTVELSGKRVWALHLYWLARQQVHCPGCAR